MFIVYITEEVYAGMKVLHLHQSRVFAYVQSRYMLTCDVIDDQMRVRANIPVDLKR